MDDPRRFPHAAGAPASLVRVFALAEESQGAETAQHADACDAAIAAAIDDMLRPDAGGSLAALFAAAPSAAVYRHLWRILALRERAGASDPSHLVRVFALPVIVVAGRERADGAATVLSCVLADAPALAAILREKGALARNSTLAIGNTLVGVDALGFDRLPEFFAWRALGESSPKPLPPSPISVAGGSETVHLRFLIGTALAAAGADLFRDQNAGGWGMPLAQALSSALAAPGVSVLALPRAPLPLVEAAWQGRLAQREVGAQVFASNAIRKLRAATGEPTAVISVHRIEGDEPGGEVRLSLSSPFDPALGGRLSLPADAARSRRRRRRDAGRAARRLPRDRRAAQARRASGSRSRDRPAAPVQGGRRASRGRAALAAGCWARRAPSWPPRSSRRAA